MSEASARPGPTTALAAGAALGLRAAFGATLLLSALLLFSLQPLFAKMVLPRLGGTPAVWSIAMVFFQAMLLAGYAYAHILVRFTGRFGVFLHAIIMALAFLWLPVAIADGFAMPPASSLPLWVLALFAVSVGVPFFAVAANAPLLQAWFSRTGDRRARDPYFLYGASNIGSFLALVSYPTVIEPTLRIAEQSRLWTIGYAVLSAAVIGCGIAALLNRSATSVESLVMAEPAATRPSLASRLEWTGFAFLPSALLVAVTAHLSTNIAAAPFLWVMPLAIFLLSFVVVFTSQPFLPPRTMQAMLPIALPAAMATVSFPGILGGLPGIAINLAALFVVAIVWHGELFARRPKAANLTEFYLYMSIGGVLGGAFTSLLAPVIFRSVAEFPLLLAASLIAIPEMRAMLFRRKVLPFTVAGSLALAFIVVGLAPGVEFRSRNFFGVLSTRISDNGAFRVLKHGTTVHGAERLSEVVLPPPARPTPLTYYGAGGPLAEGIRITRAAHPDGVLAVGVVGLGAGSLACYSLPGDRWRFFEIDPEVKRIAKDPRFFNFMSRCQPDAPILSGDARLTLEGDPDAGLDLLVIDAFSSDAIPVHLMTGNALQLYMRKTAPDGIVLLHISNGFMELASVVAATAKAEGLAAVFMDHERTDVDYSELMLSSSDVVALARDPSTLRAFLAAGWKPLVSDGSVAAWTDDYSNIVGAVLRMQGFERTPRLTP